jgi:hypothetical protein
MHHGRGSHTIRQMQNFCEDSQLFCLKPVSRMFFNHISRMTELPRTEKRVSHSFTLILLHAFGKETTVRKKCSKLNLPPSTSIFKRDKRGKRWQVCALLHQEQKNRRKFAITNPFTQAEQATAHALTFLITRRLHKKNMPDRSKMSYNIFDLVFGLAVAACPVVACTASLRIHQKVFRIIQLAKITSLDAINNTILKI